MKIKILIFALLASAGISNAGAIRKAVLNYNEENIVRISMNEPLTIVMPFPLQEGAIAGGAITTNPEKSPAPFFIKASNATPTLMLRALRKEGETTMNIVSPTNQIAVLRLIVDEYNNDSAVTFRLRQSVSGNAASADYHPVNVSAYLERTFLYPLLKKGQSVLIDNSEEFGYKEKVSEFASGVNLELNSAVRWKDPHPRLVVFNASLKNTTNEDIIYDRHSFEVLVGDNRYRPAISHCSGVIKAGDTHPVQLCLSENDYPDITAINLKENDIQFALAFEQEPLIPVDILSNSSLLPSLK